MSEKSFTAVGELKFIMLPLILFSVILRLVSPLSCPFFLRFANIS